MVFVETGAVPRRRREAGFLFADRRRQRRRRHRLEFHRVASCEISSSSGFFAPRAAPRRLDDDFAQLPTRLCRLGYGPLVFGFALEIGPTQVGIKVVRVGNSMLLICVLLTTFAHQANALGDVPRG